MFRFRPAAASPLGRTWFYALTCALATSACAQAAGPTPVQAPVASEAVVAAFKRADNNSDGMLTRDEAAHLPAIYAQFDELDVDHDGLLSFAEFSTWLAKAN